MTGEILSPAGSADCAIAAVNAGCDAIYIGGRAFNARRFASSPTDEELKEIIDECHLRGVKVHITLNTLYKDKELNDVLSFAAKMYSYGADAFIIQDLGFLALAKKAFPHIALHGSTQLTAHSRGQTLLLKSLGFNRIVLSRELNFNQIAEIASEGMETECFVHGALCVSFSGRCLMSSLLGGRSGNRGSCAQPCRMEYRLISEGKQIAKGCLLSPKDQCIIEHTKELMDLGVTSWKIEGRMKPPEYVYLVTSLYRKYRDNPHAVTEKELKELIRIFSRGGELSTGYYYTHSGQTMLSASPKNTGIYIGRVISARGSSCAIKLTEPLSCGDGIEIWTRGEHIGTGISKAAKAGDTVTLSLKGRAEKGDKVFKSFDKALADSLKNTYGSYTRRREVKAELKAEIGRPLLLRLATPEGITAECEGAVAEKPQNSPLTYKALTDSLSKTGDTPFYLNFGNGTCEPLYVPLSSLKALKRSACDKLENAIRAHCQRAKAHTLYTLTETKKALRSRLTVQTTTKEQLSAALEHKNIDIYCELNPYNVKNGEYLAQRAHKNGSRLYYALPSIDEAEEKTREYIRELNGTSCDGYLLRNLSLTETAKPLFGDYTLNTFNGAAFRLLREQLNFSRVCLSPELNLKELKPLCGEGSEIIVYGRLPLMTTRQCPIGNFMAGKGEGKHCALREKHPSCVLKDRKNAEFPVITQCDGCVALILNSAPIFMGDKWQDIASLGCEGLRLIFTVESGEEASRIISLYESLVNGEIKCTKSENGSFSHGHFFRGVL